MRLSECTSRGATMRIQTGIKTFSLAFLMAGLASQASAQDIRIGELRAHLYLEGSGRLSEDILTMKAPKLVNLPRGEGVFNEPVNTMIFNVGLLGAKNSQPKFATALVNITTTNRTGQRKTEVKPILGLVFGDEGRVNRAIVLENITCSKVEIEVKSKGLSKKVSLNFECNDPQTAEAATAGGKPAQK
jgi:hypothetical protein